MRIHKIKENQIETVVEIAVNILGQSATDTRSYIGDTIKMTNGAVFIAENDYNVLGFIRGTFTSWNKIGNIGLISTIKEARGKSVGKSLMIAFEKWAREKGARKIYVDTDEDNKTAQIFYIKCGYIPEFYMKDYYKDGLAGINFAKYL